MIQFFYFSYSWRYCATTYNLLWWYFGILPLLYANYSFTSACWVLNLKPKIHLFHQIILCTKEYVKTFVSNVVSFILDDDCTNFLFFFPAAMFGNITVNYTYESSNQTFKADLKDVQNAKCGNEDCENVLNNLEECSQIKNISVSNDSCAPATTIDLYVPPGECQFLSIWVFRATEGFHVCVPVLLQANVVRKKNRGKASELW